MHAGRGESFPTQVPDALIRSVPETMEAFLQSLDETYGSTTGFFRRAGIQHDVIEVVRDRLLEPVSC